MEAEPAVVPADGVRRKQVRLPRFGDADLGDVIARRVPGEAARLDEGQGDFHLMRLHVIGPRLRLDLPRQEVEVGLRHVARPVAGAEGLVDGPERQAVDGGQVARRRVQVQRGRGVGQFLRLPHLLQYLPDVRLHGGRVDGAGQGGRAAVRRPGQGQHGRCPAVPADDGAPRLGDGQRRQGQLPQAQRDRGRLPLRRVQRGKCLAVGLLELGLQQGAVLFGQVQPGRVRVADDLAQAAGGGLQHEVVGRLQLAGEGAGEQTGAVPAPPSPYSPPGSPDAARAGSLSTVEVVHLLLRGLPTCS